jgi:hypothetical protein
MYVFQKKIPNHRACPAITFMDCPSKRKEFRRCSRLGVTVVAVVVVGVDSVVAASNGYERSDLDPPSPLRVVVVMVRPNGAAKRADLE